MNEEITNFKPTEMTFTINDADLDKLNEILKDINVKECPWFEVQDKYGNKARYYREPHWIPCSERLPEDGRQVLVFARSVHFALAKYDEMREADGTYKKQWVTFDAWKPFYTIKEVIAWMPLPSPYQEEGEEE